MVLYRLRAEVYRRRRSCGNPQNLYEYIVASEEESRQGKEGTFSYVATWS